MPEPSAFEFEMATEKLKRYKSPSIDQIPAESIKAEGSKICYNERNCLSTGRGQSLYYIQEGW